MKRVVLLIIFLFITICTTFADINLRDYDEFDIPQGTFIPAISLQEFSTAYVEEGDTLKFVATSNVYMFDKIVIPEGTKFTGYIDEKHEPIRGTHASMKIFVNKMYLPDGYEAPIKAFIYSSNNNLIGGGLTEPEKYINLPHYQRWAMFRAMSTLQTVPGPTRRMGEHVTISSGSDLIIVLVAPIHITHTKLNM